MDDPGPRWWDDEDYLLGLVAEVLRCEPPPLHVPSAPAKPEGARSGASPVPLPRRG